MKRAFAARGFSCSQTKACPNAARGFTLAEVLITLTIIGVIAAITIPNLMQVWKKHEVEVGVKEAYSILANTLKMAQAEGDGGISDMVETAFKLNSDQYDAYTYFTEKYLLPYLKYTKTCNVSVSQAECGIFTDTILKEIDGRQTSAGSLHSDYRYRVLLQNGMFLSVGNSRAGTGPITFHFDINGGKGPNKIAHDIFFFTIQGTTCTNSNDYYCPQKDFIIGGYEGTSKHVYDSADLCTTANGGDCAVFIQKNGWKIPDNYPVKKW